MKEKKLLSNSEIASFCGQTGMLLQAGITPAEAINIMKNDAPTDAARELLTEIQNTCRQGEPFHQALTATGVFPDYVLHMIALGEESGNLDDCIGALATYYEKEEAIYDSIKNAISYPFVMIAMMVAVIFVLISKVMPIFNQVFIELGSEMTGFAASLLVLGNNLNKYSVVLLVLVCLLFVLYLFLTKTAYGRQAAHRILQRLPFTRGFFESVSCERFARGMAIALSSGMDTFTGLDMIGKLVGNSTMQTKIANCKKSIEDGSNFAEALTSSGIFNNLHSQMIAVGFKTGNIDSVLDKIANNYEKATDKKIQSLLSILEPTLVIILSVIVGLILLSVILPLMGIMSSIG